MRARVVPVLLHPPPHTRESTQHLNLSQRAGARRARLTTIEVRDGGYPGAHSERETADTAPEGLAQALVLLGKRRHGGACEF